MMTMTFLATAWRSSRSFLLAGSYEFLHYALAAGLVWLVFYILFRRTLMHRKIIEKFPHSRHVRREIFLSLLTCLIYGAVAVLSFLAVHRHWTQLYWDIKKHGMPWFWTSILLTIFVHDAYFYWTHRLMHHRRLFPLMHKAHHISVNPTPWAAYAFDPWEAVVQAAIFPLILVLYPIHPLAFFLFMIWQVSFNVFGHCGFEVFPSWFLRSWLGKFLNTPTNHAMHHQYFRGNYGLYFNFWDRWMGTNHAQYEERFHEVTTRKRHPAI